MPIDDSYKSDELILLVGSNPLPNYVAIRLLAKENGKIIFVHTDKTINYADYIKKCIKENSPELNLNFDYVQVGEADRSEILSSLDKQLSPLIKNSLNISIGLNYTGGTKPMAVHVYEWVKRNVRKPVFSYLDSRTFSMVTYHDEDSNINKQRVLEEVTMSLADLLEIQGFNRKDVENSKEYEPQYGEQALKMVGFMEKYHDDWRNWCNCNIKYEKGVKNNSSLIPVNIPEGILHEPFDYFNISSDIKTFGDIKKYLNFNSKKLENFAGWLDGKWLEDYVLDCVKEIAAECKITDYGRNITVTNPKVFELDVAFIRGYQSFGISCTTDSGNLSKNKAFEAYIRTRQMGGEEARMALVCYYNDPQKLQYELKEEWQTKGHVKVYGKDDIKDLKDKLKDWIKNID